MRHLIDIKGMCLRVPLACIVAMLIACLMLAGCTAAPPSSSALSSATASETSVKSDSAGMVQVVLPTNVVNMAHQDVDDVVADLKAAGEGHYESIEWQGAEGVDHTITVTLQEGERAWWVARSAELAADVADQFSAMGDALGQDGYRIVISEGRDEVAYHYNLIADPATQIAPYFYACEYYCVMSQIFASDEPGVWSMRNSIYNSDTGKLVKESFTSNEVTSGGLTYTAEDWERSYEQ